MMRLSFEFLVGMDSTMHALEYGNPPKIIILKYLLGKSSRVFVTSLELVSHPLLPDLRSNLLVKKM